MEDMPKSVTTFLLNVASTVLGGVILAVLFFWARETWFPLPSVTGQWSFQMHTERTNYNPYQDMELRYVAILWREGPNIRGTIEKVHEKSSIGEREYIGSARTRGTVEGHIDKKIFSKDLVHLHLVEDGHGREVTHFHELKIQDDGHMTGRFFSTVADSEGEALWKRDSLSTSRGGSD